MIEQIKIFKGNAIALEIIEGFSTVEEKVAQKYFKEKINEGHDHVNILVKFDQKKLKLSDNGAEALIEDVMWFLRNHKKVGNIAIVAHSEIMKFLVPIDNLFYKRMHKDFEERYFDIAQLNDAMEFIET